MAGNEICWTVKLDEDDWKVIEMAIMTIEKRLERLEAILDARGLDWDHPRVASDHFVGAGKMVADEPLKKWRILEPGEVVCSSDWICARSNLPSDPPNGLGWKPQIFSTGVSVSKYDDCVFARPVFDEPAEEPPKKWRILDPGEVVQEGDWVNAKDNKPDEDPPGGGWIPARASVIGGEASQAMGLYVARLVADEPAKEAEHPAGPKPDPGEGYRILSKNPAEDLQQGDEYRCRREKQWIESNRVREGYLNQLSGLWYRRKIETAKTPEPEYREPVLPADAGKLCEFSDDGESWVKGYLKGFDCDRHWNEGAGWLRAQNFSADRARHRHARIKKDA